MQRQLSETNNHLSAVPIEVLETLCSIKGCLNVQMHEPHRHYSQSDATCESNVQHVDDALPGKRRAPNCHVCAWEKMCAVSLS